MKDTDMNNLHDLYQMGRHLPDTETMPVFFFGHGTPMNALELNEFTRQWRQIGANLPKPAAILAISAHWLTQGGTAVTAMNQPQTIHDFGGFPKALFDMQYPALGHAGLVQATIQNISLTKVHEDMEWGLDHGTWSVLTHVFPEADVPVVQLSIDYSQNGAYHIALGKQLAALRRKGVLIVASGNMVHNLRMMSRTAQLDEAFGFDWAWEANDVFKDLIVQREYERLANWQNLGEAVRLAIPTPDHYYPMLYALGLQEANDELSFFNDKAVMGSLTMTSFRLDARV
ncbi:subunit B of extradiol ring-cleavage dioxygenase [Vitreoscilla sp. C1]|nr:subunit B of extradiol ring-cleavage dioxygenase [Vitreoscilla sp. C1]